MAVTAPQAQGDQGQSLLRVRVGWTPTGVVSECSGKALPGSPTEHGAAPAAQCRSRAGPRVPEQLLSGAASSSSRCSPRHRTVATPVSEWGFPGGSDGKESACNAGDLSLIPDFGRFSWRREQVPTQCSCLENPWTEEPGWDHRVRHD